MKKNPYGITDFKELITLGHEYMDKTMYLPMLDDVLPVVTYHRPSGFGKSLFTSTMYYYYDVKSEDEFESLFKGTYVYEHPSSKKNNYYVLKFDFSRLIAAGWTNEELREEFMKRVWDGIKEFNEHYGCDFKEDSVPENSLANDVLMYFLSYVRCLKLDKSVYVIIDDYDSYVKAVLKGESKEFRTFVGDLGMVKAFYAVIKSYYGDGVVSRVFITGTCPVALDGLSGGFNIAWDLTNDPRFHSMIGLSYEEAKRLVDGLSNEKNLYDVMVDNYGGYLFTTYKADRVLYTVGVLYFLKKIEKTRVSPENLCDEKEFEKYDTFCTILALFRKDDYEDVIQKLMKNGKISERLSEKVSLLGDYHKEDIVSLLFYFGYLTIEKEGYGYSTIFTVPKRMIRKIKKCSGTF